MPITVTIDPSESEREELYQLRHRVFAGCGYIDPRHDGRLEDAFDAAPTAVNVVVVREGRVVAGVRFAAPGPAGVPADGYYDFRPHLPAEARVGSVSMLVVEPRCLRVPRLLSGMLSMGFHWARRRGLTHLMAPVAPDCEALSAHVGFRRVAPRFLHERLGLWVCPMLLDMTELDERMVEAVESHCRLPFSTSEWHLFRTGEAIPASSSVSYVVARGQVALADAALRAPLPTTLGPGGLFRGRPDGAQDGGSPAARSLTDVDLLVLAGVAVAEPGYAHLSISSN